MEVDYKDNDSWDIYGRFQNVSQKPDVARKEISFDDEKEFERMQKYIDSSENVAVSDAYKQIIKTFTLDEITKKDTKLCLESMRKVFPSPDKEQYNQMLYWASRCCEYTKKEEEVKKKRATNNFHTYKRFELFIMIRNNSDNENFEHLNRCVNDIDKLNIPTRIQISFVQESQKICTDEKFIKNCQSKKNKSKRMKKMR